MVAEPDPCDHRIRPHTANPEDAITGPAYPTRRLYRRLDDRFFAGVASGIAAHLNVPVVAVRIAFVVLLGMHGLGALLYAVFWAILPIAAPAQSGAVGPGGEAMLGPERPRRRDLAQMLPYAAIAAGVLMMQALIGSPGPNAALGWLVAITAVGAGIIWHQSGPEWWRRGAGATGAVFGETDRPPSVLLRFVGGGVLVAIGIMAIVAVLSPVSQSGFAGILNSALLAIVGVGAVALAAAPLLWRSFGQVRAEREARIREQERGELAAMVHDQVLHTLALIQRSAGDTKTVQRLARGQERMLRNWLYKPTGSPSERFGAALEEVAAEVEDTYAIAVETVVVGDRAVDERLGAMVAAAREALVNAARHAKVPTVSLYAEVEPELVSVFVRDRGTGFSLSAVEDNRHGVRGSIIGRMQRHGGQAEIHSEPGEGTEVRLTLPVSKEAPAS